MGVTMVACIMFEEKVITIAGGGFSGTAIVATQVREIINAWDQAGQSSQLPSTRIIIADPSAHIGPGIPYAHDVDLYSLNQPAYAMSPFPDEPDHFVNWLVKRKAGLTQRELENSFQSRQTYGEYLRNIFDEAVNTANQSNCPISIEQRQTTITDVMDVNGRLTISSDGKKWNTDSFIIADGHHQNEFLTEFNDHPEYFSGVVSNRKINEISNFHGRVLIVGSGQTMIDRLAELDAAGYKGHIDVVSRRGVLPWVFDPELYREDRGAPDYVLQHFTPENISECNSFEELKRLWDNEIQYANNHSTGYGVGHVLGKVFSDSAILQFDHEQPSPHGWKKMKEHIEAVYGNPTRQERYDMLQNYKKSGQLSTISSSIRADQITALDTNGFEVSLATQPPQKYDAIFNSASCARTLKSPAGQIRSPLIAKLNERGMIKWDPLRHGLITAGQQLESRMHYTGPYSYSRWGCESFRDGHRKVALQTLEPDRFKPALAA